MFRAGFNCLRPRLAVLLTWLLGAPIAYANDSACTRPLEDALALLTKMEQAWEQLSDYSAILLKAERFTDAKTTDEQVFIKFRKPDQLYLQVLEGANAGAELLYPKPGTSNIILARPGGFTGSVAGFLGSLPALGQLVPHEFDLNDGRLMEGQHHPLPDSTIGGMIRLIATNIRTAVRHREGTMCFHPGEIVNGQPAVKVEVLFPTEKGIWHTVTEGESFWTVGRTFDQDRYVILYNNPSIDAEHLLPPGQPVFVPRYYAQRALVWISESNDLPIKVQMYDNKQQLYESYANIDLRIDAGFTDEEFDPAYHGFPTVTTSDEEKLKAQSIAR